MILIVGATGSLGGAITHALLARKTPVRILVRQASSTEAHGGSVQELIAAGAQPVYGDLKNRGSLDVACEGTETVITTANSALRGGADNPQTVDLEGNRNLIDAATAAGVKHFIFVSAQIADPNSPTPFLSAKGKTEQYLQACGLSYTIIAPAAFMEVWIGLVVGMPALGNRPVTIVGSGERKHTFITAGDVAQFAVACVGNPKAMNRKLIVGGPQPVSFRDAARTFGRIVGREIAVQSVHPGEPISGLPQSMVEMLAGFDVADSVLDSTALASQFGVTLTTLEEFAARLTQESAATQ